MRIFYQSKVESITSFLEALWEKSQSYFSLPLLTRIMNFVLIITFTFPYGFAIVFIPSLV